jgi:hypothetical protein
MKDFEFKIESNQLAEIISKNPNLGKNSHIGNLAVKIVELYFQSLDSNATFVLNKKGIDLEVNYLGKIEQYEVKGTVDKDISWGKLKVSSLPCYNSLVNGLPIIRVTNVGSTNPRLTILKFNEDFKLVEEPRWRLSKIK